MKKNWLLAILSWVLIAVGACASSAKLRQLFFHLIALLCVCVGVCLPVYGTDISVAALPLPNNRFAGLPADRLGTSATVTNNSTSVTLTVAHGFDVKWAGMSGLRIQLAGVDYTCSAITYDLATTTGTFTLTSAYAASTASVAWKIYSYAVLRLYALQSFQPAGKSYIVQSGVIGSANWYQQVAVPVKDGTAYIPAITLDATLDSTNNQAQMAAWFYTPSGALLKVYDCFAQFKIPSTSPSTSWGAICSYNTVASPVAADQTIYSKPQVDALVAGLCGTTCTNFTIGSGTASSNNTFDLKVSNDTNAPRLRYNGTTGRWQYSDNGTSFTNFDPSTNTSINGLVGAITLSTGTAGTDFALATAGQALTLNIPQADGTHTGKLAAADWTTFNAKVGGSGTSGYVPRFTAPGTIAAGQIQDDNNGLVKVERSALGAALELRVASFDASFNGILTLLRSAGTAASPVAVGSGVDLGELRFAGQYNTTPNNTNYGARIYALTTESWSASNNGTDLYLAATSNGSGSAGASFSLRLTGAELRFYGSGGGYTALKKGSSASNVSFTLPDADGSASTCLQTNGSGVLSFGACGSGGGVADPGGNGIMVRTALNTTINRSIAVGTGLSVSNATGVAGDPTISLGTSVVTSVVNDTNVTGSISANALTLGWTGQLAGSRGGTGVNSSATFPASGTVDTGTGTTGKLPKWTTGTSGIIGDSIITESSTKIGINQSSPNALLANGTGGLLADPAGTTASATDGFAWVGNTSAKYAASISNTSNTTGAGGLLIGNTNTNGNSPALLVQNGTQGAFAVTAGKVRMGTALSADLSVGMSTAPDLWIQTSGTTSSTYSVKVDSSSTIFSVRNDGVLSSKVTLTDTSGLILSSALNTVLVAQGGTGQTTFSSNGIVYGNSGSGLLVTAQGAANSILTANAGAPSFSQTPQIQTSVTIGVASSVTGQLKLANSGNGNILSLKAGSTGSNITFQLPADTGTNGYVLTTDGGNPAVLTWAAQTGSGGSSVWSALTPPVASLSLSMASNTTTFTFGATTGSGVDLFNFLDTASNTGTGHLVRINAASGSSLKPVQISANGNGVEMTTGGFLTSMGSGGLDASGLVTGTVNNSRLTAQVVLTNQSNTWTTGTQDFGAATNLKVPVGAGAAPTTSGFIAYDSTANIFKGGINGATDTFAFLGQANTFTVNQEVRIADTATTTTSTGYYLTHNSSNTPAANFGVDLQFQLKSTTTTSRTAAAIGALWTTATDASRTSAVIVSTVNSAASLAEVARFSGNGNFTFTGQLIAGSGPTTVTDATGKVLSAAINTIAVAQGGTGITSGTSGGVPYFSGSTTIASSAALAANAIVVGGGAGTAPSTDASATLSAGALTLGASGTAGSVTMGNATSGTIVLQPVTGALGSVTVSLPAVTDTLVGKATTDTLTNKTLTSPIISTISNTGTLTLPTSTDTLVGKATTDTLTNKTLDADAGTGNHLTVNNKIYLAAGGCNNATPSSFFDLPTASAAAAACVTGTNQQKGVLQYVDSGETTAQVNFPLPAGQTGAIDAKIFFTTTDVTNGHTIKWKVYTACTQPDNNGTDDPSYNAAQTVTYTVGASAVSGNLNTVSQTALTQTGCAAGYLFHLKVGRDTTDTATTTINLVGVELTVRRTLQ